MNLYEALERIKSNDNPLYEDDLDEQQYAVSQREMTADHSGYWYDIITDSRAGLFVCIYADVGSKNILYWMDHQTPQPIGMMNPECVYDNNWKLLTRRQLFLFNGGNPEDWEECVRLAHTDQSDIRR